MNALCLLVAKSENGNYSTIIARLHVHDQPKSSLIIDGLDRFSILNKKKIAIQSIVVMQLR